MFGLSMGEILLLAAIALIAIGPRQLPEVARTIGRLLNEFRDATRDFQRAFFDMKNETDRTVEKFQSSVERALTSSKPSPPEALNSSESKPENAESEQLSFDLNNKGS